MASFNAVFRLCISLQEIFFYSAAYVRLGTQFVYKRFIKTNSFGFRTDDSKELKERYNIDNSPDYSGPDGQI